MTRAIDITARIEPDGVSIKLPRLRVEVSRRQAERLRDVLSTILPERITDLMHDPRINDLDVLRAAQAMLAERGQDTESLSYAIDHIKASRNPKRCALCNCDATDEVYGFPVCGYHVDHTEDDPQCPKCAAPETYWSDQNGNHWCDPCVVAPDDTEGLTRAAPQPGDEWWCHECSAWLPATAAEEADEDGRQILREVRATRPARVPVVVGDRVRDPHDGTWREIVHIEGHVDGGTAHMRDGGCMSVAECARCEIRLPSENLSCPACEAWADGGRILTEEQWAVAVDALCIECGVAGRTRGMHS